jgi:hypothetical protein
MVANAVFSAGDEVPQTYSLKLFSGTLKRDATFWGLSFSKLQFG